MRDEIRPSNQEPSLGLGPHAPATTREAPGGSARYRHPIHVVIRWMFDHEERSYDWRFLVMGNPGCSTCAVSRPDWQLFGHWFLEFATDAELIDAALDEIEWGSFDRGEAVCRVERGEGPTPADELPRLLMAVGIALTC